MRGKNLAWLWGITVRAVVAAIVVSRGTGPRSNPRAGTPVMPELAKRMADLGKVVINHADQKTTIERNGTAWTIVERGGYPVDLTKLRQALLGLADLTYFEPKTAQSASYPRLEVEDPGKDSKSILVTLADTKGALLGEAIIGKHRADQLGGGEGGVYVRKPGNEQSWLARGTLDLAGNTADWLDKKLLDLPAAQMKLVVLAQPDGSKVTLTRDKPADKLHLADMPKDKKLKYDSILDDTAGVLGGLQLEDVRPAKGFDYPTSGVAKAQFVTFAGLTVDIELADKDGKSWARFAVSGSGDAAKEATALSAQLSPWIYALPSDKAKTLRDKLDDLVETPKAS